MATVSFGSGVLHNAYMQLTQSSGDHSLLHHTGGTNGDEAHIKMMSGTMPSDFTTLTGPNDLSGQVLWYTQGIGNKWDLTTDGNSMNTQMTLNQTDYNVATASGTAEWFWYHVNDSTTYNTGNIKFQFIGSVGTSGTDLILPSTSIVSGKYYRVRGITLTLQSEYTY